jgi:plasmid stability protein
MTTITVKGLAPGLHQALKSRARAHGRSLNREIISTLETAVHAVRVDAATLAGQARAVREGAGVYLTQVELTRLKNAGRR